MRASLRTTGHAETRGGFALALVVFLLFAATVAGLTGYQIVSAEASLAEGSENQEEALSVAEAGIRRYVGEHIGIPGTATYAIGDGNVTITPRRVSKVNDSTDVYLLTAVGTVTDPRYPTSPATRTVRQYAKLNRRPVRARAAVMTIQNDVNIVGSAEINGSAFFDAGSAECPTNDTNNLVATGGLVGSGISNGTITGSPAFTSLGSVAAVISAAALRWSVLKDPTFPIPYDGSWPNFSAIPADSFPVIRVTGNYTLDRNGRGTLIVTGNFIGAGNWEWKGIILAGGAVSTSYTPGPGTQPTVKGVVVSGLNGSAFAGQQSFQRWRSRWYPCYVRKANLAIAYLTPITASSWSY